MRISTNEKAIQSIVSKNSEFYARKRSRRLRKKLHVGEFMELGVAVKAITHPISDDDFDDMYDDICDRIIEHGMSEDEPQWNLGFASAGRNKDGSYTMLVIVEYDHRTTDVSVVLDLLTYHLGDTKIVDSIEHIDLWNVFD